MIPAREARLKPRLGISPLKRGIALHSLGRFTGQRPSRGFSRGYP